MKRVGRSEATSGQVDLNSRVKGFLRDLGSRLGRELSMKDESASVLEKWLDDSRRGNAQKVYQLVLLTLLLLLCLLNYSSREGLSALFWWRIFVSVLLVVVFFLFLRHLSYYRRGMKVREVQISDLRAEVRQLQTQLARLEPEKTQERVEGEIDKKLKELGKRLVGSNLPILTDSFFTILSQDWQLVQGILFLYDPSSDEYRSQASYAYFSERGGPRPFREGETLTGQVVRESKPLLLKDLPSEYRIVASGLGKRAPRVLRIDPLGRRVEPLAENGSPSEDGQSSKVAFGALETAFFLEHSDFETELLTRFIGLYWKRLLSLGVLEGADATMA